MCVIRTISIQSDFQFVLFFSPSNTLDLGLRYEPVFCWNVQLMTKVSIVPCHKKCWETHSSVAFAFFPSFFLLSLLYIYRNNLFEEAEMGKTKSKERLIKSQYLSPLEEHLSAWLKWKVLLHVSFAFLLKRPFVC